VGAERRTARAISDTTPSTDALSCRSIGPDAAYDETTPHLSGASLPSPPSLWHTRPSASHAGPRNRGDPNASQKGIPKDHGGSAAGMPLIAGNVGWPRHVRNRSAPAVACALIRPSTIVALAHASHSSRAEMWEGLSGSAQ
jgi:hypothetical protein